MEQIRFIKAELERLSWWTPFLGAPLAYKVEQKIGREVKEAEFVEILAFLRIATKKQGEVKQRIGVLEWENKTDVEAMQVFLSSARCETNLMIGAQYAGLAFFAFFTAGFAGFALSATLAGFLLAPKTVPGAAMAVAAGVALAHWVARTLWRRTAVQRERGIQVLLERLADRIGEDHRPGQM